MSNILQTAEKEMVRTEILTLCSMAAPEGASTKVVMAALKKSGYRLTEAELDRQVDYLAGKGLITSDNLDNERLGIHRRILKTTPFGTDYLEGNIGSVTGIGE